MGMSLPPPRGQGIYLSVARAFLFTSQLGGIILFFSFVWGPFPLPFRISVAIFGDTDLFPDDPCRSSFGFVSFFLNLSVLPILKAERFGHIFSLFLLNFLRLAKHFSKVIRCQVFFLFLAHVSYQGLECQSFFCFSTCFTLSPAGNHLVLVFPDFQFTWISFFSHFFSFPLA